MLLFTRTKMVKGNDKTNTREGGKGKRGRTVLDDAGGKYVHTGVYFVDKVKDKRRNKNNNLEFLIGCRGFPDPNHDTWEPLGHLSG